MKITKTFGSHLLLAKAETESKPASEFAVDTEQHDDVYEVQFANIVHQDGDPVYVKAGDYVVLRPGQYSHTVVGGESYVYATLDDVIAIVEKESGE